jgi:hypothetical protein
MSQTHQINIIFAKQRQKIKPANIRGRRMWIEGAYWTGSDGKLKKFEVRF